ncbi:MAG: hypothetical protein Ta2E_06530 [Mycoplasmoidaceae bacterium]|nr:MAG: hypothetical protein Ta2E_06530 [Mycoplasmoidaceae bacterium]
MITLLSQYRMQNKRGRAHIVIGFVELFLLLTAIIGSFVYSFINHGIINPLLGWLGYFTTIGSFISVIYLICWIVNFYKPLKSFNDSLFLIIAVAYEIFIFGGYSINYFSGDMFNDPTFEIKIWNVFNALIHFVCPWVMVIFFGLHCYSKRIKIRNSIPFIKIHYGLIVPLVYCVYILILYYAYHISQYGYYTNFWNFNNVIDAGNKKAIGAGHWTRMFFILIWGVCIYISLLSFWFFDKQLKLREKKVNK